VPAGHAELARAFADVVNLSRTGVLLRTASAHPPGDEWPLVLEVSRTTIRVWARVVRCELLPARRGEREVYSVALTFQDVSAEAQAVIDRVCAKSPSPAKPRRLSISFARRCPSCGSRAVAKRGRHAYVCTSCERPFAGVRLGVLRFAR
jgi:PilZ domain-containing protein